MGRADAATNRNDPRTQPQHTLLTPTHSSHGQSLIGFMYFYTMGHDIAILCNHQLNTSNVHALAQDLSKRFNAIIQFGFDDEHSFYRDPAADPTHDYCPLGVINMPGTDKAFRLRDHSYQLKQFHQDLGPQFFELEYVKQDSNLVDNFKADIFRQYYSLEEASTGKEVADIFTDWYSCRYFYYTRWWHFCQHFTTEDHFDPGFVQLNRFRKNIQWLLQLCGGHEVVLVDDQGPTGQLENEDDLWPEILEKLDASFKASLCHIPAFMQAGTPRKAGDYPLAFYDDFADLM